MTERVIIVDTETGGFSPERNPLLSIAILLGDPTGILGSLSIKLKPPENTFLEIPLHDDQLKGKDKKTIEAWLNLTTGERVVPGPEKPQYLIAAQAAEINGFVGASETIPGWDFTKTALWGQATYAEALGQLCRTLEQWGPADAVICHGVQFDRKMIAAWLPALLSALPKTWRCTQTTYRKKFLGGQMKGSSVGSICKASGYTGSTADLHTALGDVIATHYVWSWLRKQGDGVILEV